MRKKERIGRIRTLVNNVNDNFGLFLKSEEVVKDQIYALGLQNELKKVSWVYAVEISIDGKKVSMGKKNGGSISKGGGF